MAAPDRAALLYLELLKKCLTRYLFIEEEVRDINVSSEPWTKNHPWSTTTWPERFKDILARVLARRGLRLVSASGDPEARALGRDWPLHAETMVGLRRLDNVQECVTDVLRRGVAGDLIETGVWRGGSVILMRAILAAYGDTDRTVWAADSFRGLPPPSPGLYPMDEGFDLSVHPELSVGLEDVRANFRKYGLLDEQVQFLVGWFKDTLPSAPIERLAVIRLDGDYYESTLDALTPLYPKLSVGGYVIVDDYNLDPCRRAVHAYREAHGIEDQILGVDGAASYWQRQV